jgi:aspartyl-tRNA(Asn)/glutamyl-tRNA(Gln) amidotransferase subunit A
MGSDPVRIGDAHVALRAALVDRNRFGNLTGLPAISMPCGITQNGLPVAVQFIGRRFADTQLIAIAQRFAENQRGWQPRHPPVD